MDFKGTSLLDTGLSYSIAAMESYDIFLKGFEGLYPLLKKLEGMDSIVQKTEIIVQHCVRSFPYLFSQAYGELEGEDFVDSEGNPVKRKYTLDELWFRSITSAKLFYALENLCVYHSIFPPFCFIKLGAALHREEDYMRLGSSIEMKSIEALMCANWGGKQSTFCLNQATKQCLECRLVSYCGRKCRREHWKLHKHVCERLNSAEASAEASARETIEELNEQDNDAPDHAVMWDRVPAFGLLGQWQPAPDGRSLPAALPNPLRLCFDGCLDLNNVLETLHQISSNYTGEATFYINCTNHQAIARNLILCFMLVSMAEHKDQYTGLDAVIAIWYSAYLTPFQFLYLSEVIRQILYRFGITLPEKLATIWLAIFENADQSMENIQGTLDMLQGTFDIIGYVGTIWESPVDRGDTRTRTRIRTRWSGFSVCKYLYAMAMLPWKSEELDATRQASIRKFDTSAKLDEFRSKPHVEALAQFRHSGLVLPYSQFSGHHTLPNSTLFQGLPMQHGGRWTVESNAVDPFSGWPINKVLESTKGAPHYVPDNDIYGSLYFYVRNRLISAIKALQNCSVTFEFSDKKTELFVDDMKCSRSGLFSIYRAMANSIPPVGDNPTQWNLARFLNGWASLLTTGGNATLVLRWEPDSKIAVPNQATASDEALSDFDIFISRFSDPIYASSLRNYRAAIGDARVDIDRLSPLFLNDVTYLTKRYQEMEEAIKAPGNPRPAMSRRTEHLASPSKPCTVAVGMVLGTQPARGRSRRKHKGKQAATSSAEKDDNDNGKQIATSSAQNDDNDKSDLITTSETCYNTIFLTMLNHLTTFSEWRGNRVTGKRHLPKGAMILAAGNVKQSSDKASTSAAGNVKQSSDKASTSVAGTGLTR